MSTLTLVSVGLSALVSAATLLVLLRNLTNSRLVKKVAEHLESEAIAQLKGEVADIKTRLIRIETKVDQSGRRW